MRSLVISQDSDVCCIYDLFAEDSTDWVCEKMLLSVSTV